MKSEMVTLPIPIDQLREEIAHILDAHKEDLSAITRKGVRQMLAKKWGLDMEDLKAQKGTISQIIQELVPQYAQDDDAGEEDEGLAQPKRTASKGSRPSDDDSSAPPPKRRRVTPGPQGDYVFPLSHRRQVTVHKFKRLVLIDIREHYEDANGAIKPGRKGISLTPEQWNKLVEAQEDISEAVRQLD